MLTDGRDEALILPRFGTGREEGSR